MLRPSLGELLRGVRIGLETSVLPVVPAGAAERQLKASLHSLRRAEKSWDRLHSTLQADNSDCESTLRSVIRLAHTRSQQAAIYSGLQNRLEMPLPAPLPDAMFTDVDTALLASHSHRLHQLVSDFDSSLRSDPSLASATKIELRATLTGLYNRMLKRERFQLGLDEDPADGVLRRSPALDLKHQPITDTASNSVEDTLQSLEIVEDALKGVEVLARRVVSSAEGVISITLEAASGLPLPAWAPGAHIDLIFDGKVERQYSLCGSTDDRQSWTVAVLREPESRGGSAWLHANLRPGEKLRARGPRNHFPLEDAESYIFIAGGVGITPIITMVREASKRGKPWKLVYGGRRRGSMAFLDELSQHGSQVTIWPQDELGHIDLNHTVGAPIDGAAVYCCGPEALISAVEKQCESWPEGALHVERFRPRTDLPQVAVGSFEIVLNKSGQVLTVQADQTIAAALEKVGVIIPTSCGEGTCGTCATKVLEGLPDHRDSFLMGRKRKENKTIMACCSRSLTPRLVLDL